MWVSLCLSLHLRLHFFPCLSLSLAVSVPRSQLRSLLLLAHFCFSLFVCLALSALPPLNPRHHPNTHTHTSQSCLRHPQGWQVGGAAAERGEGERRSLPPPQLLTFTLQASADGRGGGKPRCQLGGGDQEGAGGCPSLRARLWGDLGPEDVRQRAPPAERGYWRMSGLPKAFAGGASAQRSL